VDLRTENCKVVSNPAITVVIPTRDRSSLVCRALLSVARQTYAATDVIVVDDGSADDTVSAIQRLGVTVRVIDGGGGGAAAARNAGVAATRTEWVAFLDSDDVWSEDHLERLRRAIEATHGAAALYFSDAALPDGTTAFGRSGFAPQAPLERVEHGDRWALLPVQPMMTPATVVSRAAYLACGGQDAALPCREDTHLFLLLGLGGGTCAVAARTVTVTDDARSGRLTEQLPGSDAVYWIATARLYEDILRRFPALAPSQARELRRRLATAHWRLGRLSWRRRRRGEAAGSAWRSARNDPSVILGRLARRR
jgi:glycosyltransferase involved in cell wall biosynthesis